jgi:hypothetical protein
VLAAVAHGFHQERPELPDTGSLRGDMAELMRSANERRVGYSALLIYHLGPYFQETGTSPADLREQMLGHEPSAVDAVLDRAAARGEVDTSRLPPRLRTLAVDLFRHEALMSLRPVPDEVIDSILDDVYIPLVTARLA